MSESQSKCKATGSSALVAKGFINAGKCIKLHNEKAVCFISLTLDGAARKSRKPVARLSVNTTSAIKTKSAALLVPPVPTHPRLLPITLVVAWYSKMFLIQDVLQQIENCVGGKQLHFQKKGGGENIAPKS